MHTHMHARIQHTHIDPCATPSLHAHTVEVCYSSTLPSTSLLVCGIYIYRSGQIGQVFVLTVSVYIESRYVQHLFKSPFHCSLTPPSYHTLRPQEALLADYTESRHVGSPEFNTQVADVFIRCTSWVSQKWCLCAFSHNAHTAQTHTHTHTYKTL